jgi:hypothetical protein
MNGGVVTVEKALQIDGLTFVILIPILDVFSVAWGEIYVLIRNVFCCSIETEPQMLCCHSIFLVPEDHRVRSHWLVQIPGGPCMSPFKQFQEHVLLCPNTVSTEAFAGVFGYTSFPCGQSI